MFKIIYFHRLMILLTLGSVLLKVLTGSPVFIIVSLLFSSLSFILCALKVNKVNYLLFCFYLCVLLYVIVLGLYHVASDDKNYFLYIIYITLAIEIAFIIRKFNFDYQASLFLLILSLCWTIYNILHIGYNPDAYNNLLDGSRNYISAHLVIFLAYYFFACKKEMISINLIYPTLVVVCCFFLFGRSGIALSIFLFLIAIAQRNKIYIVSFVFVCMTIVYFNKDEIISLFANSNFSHGVESERSVMLSEYISAIVDWRSFLFGVDFKDCCKTIMAFKINPHNSFINLHSRFGVLPFFMGLIIYIHMFYTRILFRSIMVNLLIFVIFARYFVDSIGFLGIVDFILVSLFAHLLLDGADSYRKNFSSSVNSSANVSFK